MKRGRTSPERGGAARGASDGRFLAFAAAVVCMGVYSMVIVSVNPLAIKALLEPVRRGLDAGLGPPLADPAPFELDEADLPSVTRLREGAPVTEVSVVLPMTLGDLPRFRLLHASLRAFLDPRGVSEIILLVPARQAPAFERLLREPSFADSGLPYAVVDEERLAPQLRRYRSLWGWYKQQVLKLAASRLVRSDFYLVLDADCLLARPLRLPDGLFDAHGRALTDMEPRATHAEWWRAAEATLGWAGPPLDPVFGVTPAVLHRAAVGAALRRLRRRFAGDWRDALLSNAGLAGWTEFSLYYVAAVGSGLFDLAHARTPTGVYRRAASLWFAGDWPAWDAAAAFAREGAGYFVVVQSNARLPAEEVARRVAPFVPGVPAASPG